MREDTGKKELEKIFTCLKENEYKFEDLEKADMEGYIIANFTKDINYTDKAGNYINDRYITIKIEFDSYFDYKNNYRDTNDEFSFENDKGTEFVKKLLDNNYGGSSRKRIIKHKKTTRKNRKKN
jgi:hypothetical protein